MKIKRARAKCTMGDENKSLNWIFYDSLYMPEHPLKLLTNVDKE